jgi:hypothetical protein
MLLSLNAAFITADMLGNDAGVRRPDVATLVAFCLQGLGAELDSGWLDRVEAGLRLPSRRRRAEAAAPRTARRARRPSQPRKRPAKKA